MFIVRALEGDLATTLEALLPTLERVKRLIIQAYRRSPKLRPQEAEDIILQALRDESVATKNTAVVCNSKGVHVFGTVAGEATVPMVDLIDHTDDWLDPVNAPPEPGVFGYGHYLSSVESDAA